MAFKYFIRSSLVVIALVAFPSRSHSADSGTPPSTEAVKAPITFRPAAKSAPAVRVTGGSRGSGDTSVTLDVLAPDQVGLTTQEQPSLFWYQSKPATAKFELTLLQENKDDPLMQVTVNRSEKAGIQRVKLSDHNIKLKPGVEYQWVVALITDPENRSSDLVASGAIQRIETPSDLKAKLASAGKTDLPAAYAEAGIWYDALEELSDQIDAKPDDQSLQAARTSLLQQVGLKAAAGTAP